MVNRFGKVDEGTTVTDFDEEEIARKHTLVGQPRLRRVEQAEDQPDRHAGHGQLSERRARRAAGRRRRARRRRRGRRRDGADGKSVGGRRRARRCRAWSSLNRLDRERASLERVAAVAARSVQPHGHSDSAADRRGEDVQRRRRSGHAGRRSSSRPTRAASSPKAPVPADMTARRRRRARGADRDGRRGRRNADGEVLRGRHADRRGAGRRAAQRRRSPASCFRWSARRRLLNIGVPQLLDAIVAYLPSPADRPFTAVDKDGSEIARAGRREGAGRGVRLEDDCRSVRRPHHDVPRRVAARSRPTRPSTTRRATRRSGSAT